MMKDCVSFLAVCAVVLTAVTTSAQDILYRAASPFQEGAGLVRALPPEQIGVIALDPVNMGRTIVNAPYTAEAITEVTQVLADGNRIDQHTSATVARDSRGRTRREQQGIALGAFVAQNARPIVTITDPATGEHIMLNYEQRIAFRSQPVRIKFDDRATPPEVAFAYRANATITSPSPGAPAVPPADTVTFEARVVEPSRMAKFRNHTAGVPSEGEPHTEKLEPRMIEGLTAEGTKTTVTIAAGAVGNALPIEIVSEQWYSPELGVVLLTRRSDPRFGETVYRLTNIDRSEPAPELFKVPADFKVQNVSRGRPTPVKPDDQ